MLDAALPEPRAGASFVAAADGILLVGGTADGTTPVKTVWKSAFNDTGDLTPWTPQAELYQEATDATAVLEGDYLWVYGGSAANGPTATVQRGEFAAENPDTPELEENNLCRFGVSGGPADLPEPRTNAAGFGASGTLYLIGGRDASGPRGELYWAIPDANGNIPEWKHLEQSDLPESAGGLAGSAPIARGPHVVHVGGETISGPNARAAPANCSVIRSSPPLRPAIRRCCTGGSPSARLSGSAWQAPAPTAQACSATRSGRSTREARRQTRVRPRLP